MGAREFTDEKERQTRRDRVEKIGKAIYGPLWQTQLAEALAKATGRPLGRARVAQWMLTEKPAPVDPTQKAPEPPKPVPAWVMVALPAIAREGAARLRRQANELDALAAEEGAPPGAQGEPEADGEPPQESGPDAAEAAGEEEFDLDALVTEVCSEPPRPLGALPGPRLTWQHTHLTGWVQRPSRGS